MSSGLFGKMPSKRDFVSLNAPRSFLGPFETWLQSGIALSKETFGGDWHNIFLQAPIWRFWIGSAVCDVNVCGVLMPSVDGIGRYFPLSVFAVADNDKAFAQASDDRMSDWYEQAESLVLETLEESFVDTPEALVAKMTAPPASRKGQANLDIQAVSGGVSVIAHGENAIAAAFEQMQQVDIASVNAQRSLWWTIGGADSPQRVMVFQGMPDPTMFAGFLSPQAISETTQ